MQPAFQFKSKGCNFQTKPNQVFKQQLQGMLFLPESCFVVLMKTFNIFLKYKMYWKESQSKLQLTGLVIKYFSQCLIRIQGFRFLKLKFITHIASSQSLKCARFEATFYVEYGASTLPISPMSTILPTLGQHRLVKFLTQEKPFYVKPCGYA